MPETGDAQPQAQNPAATVLQAELNQGMALHRQGKLADAERCYGEVLQRQPDHFDALHLLGIIACQTRRTERGVELIKRAIGLNPKVAEAHYNLGNALRDLKRCEEALASYHKAIALKPEFAVAHNNLGTALADLKRHEEALASYDRALTVRPDFAEALANRGLVLTALGRLSEARAALERAVELEPCNVKYRYSLADITPFVAGDAHLAALEKLAEDSATLSVGDRIELHFTLGKAYEDLGRHAKAFSQWLDGNALKRQQITYNEGTALGMLDRVRAVFTFELMRTWQNVGNPSPVPVFIVGMAVSPTRRQEILSLAALFIWRCRTRA